MCVCDTACLLFFSCSQHTCAHYGMDLSMQHDLMHTYNLVTLCIRTGRDGRESWVLTGPRRILIPIASDHRPDTDPLAWAHPRGAPPPPPIGGTATHTHPYLQIIGPLWSNLHIIRPI